MPDKWEQYAEAPTGDKWEQYAAPTTIPVDPLTRKTQAAAPQTSTKPFFEKPPVGTPFPSTNPIERQGQRLDVLGQREEHAKRSITPFTEAASVIYPAVGIAEKIPSAARAGAKFESVMKAAGKTPVNVEKVGEAGLRAKELVERGSSPVQVINKFMSRVTDPEKGPLTFEEARDFYTNARMNMMERWKNVGGPMWRQVTIFKEALGDAIEDAAKEAGKLEEYQDAMKEYRSAMRLKKLGLGALAYGAGKGATSLPLVGPAIKGAVKGSLSK